MSIIGRIKEQAELRRYFESGRPEFIAVTGRRRVGKTFLVRELFSDDLSFYFSGMVGKILFRVQGTKFVRKISVHLALSADFGRSWPVYFT